MKKEELMLYYRMDCPFCVRVLSFLEEESIDIPMIDISVDEQAASDLYELADRYTVPCLRVQGVPMHESLDIMNWLLENKGEIEN